MGGITNVIVGIAVGMGVEVGVGVDGRGVELGMSVTVGNKVTDGAPCKLWFAAGNVFLA